MTRGYTQPGERRPFRRHLERSATKNQAAPLFLLAHFTLTLSLPIVGCVNNGSCRLPLSLTPTRTRLWSIPLTTVRGSPTVSGTKHTADCTLGMITIDKKRGVVQDKQTTTKKTLAT